MIDYWILVNSAIATGIAELITLPICTIKTNHQNTNQQQVRSTINQMYKKGGIKIFYSASVSATLSQMLSTSSKYFLYRNLEASEYKFSNKFINGTISGVLSSLITHRWIF